MTTASLVLTLGHNASAILVRNGTGEILIGFEEERFSQIKSDSKYPQQAINACVAFNEANDKLTIDEVNIGHWFLDGKLPKQSNKYLNWEHLNHAAPFAEVVSLTDGFTHHDSHAESAQAFAQPWDYDDSHILVMDGFGTFGECMSLYRYDGSTDQRTLIKRAFGFGKSLGMFYQYSTAFQGMKMHNHEYKMLAYAVHIVETGVDIDKLNVFADKLADQFYNDLMFAMPDNTDPIVSLDALAITQGVINKILSDVLKDVGMQDADERTKRIIISYFTQYVVQEVVVAIVQFYQIKNLILAGGLFYNVQINNQLLTEVDKICIMPLAGDQGAGLGVYNRMNKNLQWPNHLFWGHRDLKLKTEHLFGQVPEGIFFTKNMESALPLIKHELGTVGYLNLVRGAMEFGPRALCNTTTLVLPQQHLCDEVNQMNDRTTEMPFAPVMTKEQCEVFFECGHKVHKSLEYMIITLMYKGNPAMMPGALHFYPLQGWYTARPQVTADPYLIELLNHFGPLVNTSFNYHGVPIVNTLEQVFDSHRKQKALAKKDFITLIVEN